MTARSAIRLHPDDNVICLLTDHDAGDNPIADGVDVPVLIGAVKSGHKVALVPIAPGGKVVKYGHPIGIATQPITPGEHVHLHNIKGLLESGET